MSTRIQPAITALVLVLAVALPATAGATPAGDCAAAKRRAVGKRVQSALNCWSLAARKQKPVDPLCLARGEAKFLIAFARAERSEGCLTLEDADAIGSAVDFYVDSVVAALPDSGTPPPPPTTASPSATPAPTTSTQTPGPSPTPTPTPTPGVCNNVSIGGACWYLGASGQSCDSRCSAEGRLYDSATETFAGSSGTDGNCEFLMLLLTNGDPRPYHNQGSGSCPAGLGCIEFTSTRDFLRCSSPQTTGAATPTDLDIARACACGTQIADSKRVFVTSTLQNGCNEIAGLAGADAKCAALASAAGLSGTFKAWLSDTSTSAAARLTHSSLPYRLVGGTQIADDWNDLTDGNLDHAIDEDELGTKVTNALGSSVYTGTMSNGASDVINNCGGWLDCGLEGLIGVATATDGSWTDGVSNPCISIGRLYCFEQ